MNFFVPGIPAPKGSARAFFVKRLNRAVITNANAKTRPWETAIRVEAERARPAGWDLAGPRVVTMRFRMPRPKGHYGAHGLRDAAPAKHTKKPDVDKLVRTVLDALTGVAFADDAQVDAIGAQKNYCADGETPGAEVSVT